MNSLETYQGASPQAIRQHYDVGNAFYRLWLDPTLTYSCAFWRDSSASLESAQLSKFDYLAEQAAVHEAARVLEVGCGWGGFLQRCVRHYGVQRALGLTISQAQYDHIRATPEPDIEVRLESWFDHNPDATYNAIVSIEAFEAFARYGLSSDEKIASYREFFKRCHAWLTAGGHLAIQTIAYGTMPPGEIQPFIIEDVFPESDLPTVQEILSASHRLFELELLRNDRLHYVRTLKCWIKQLRHHRARAVALVGEKTVQRWEQYLLHSISGFASGKQILTRFSFRRID